MSPWPDTESKLVQRLADPRDDAAWNRFDALYRPVIYRYARGRGLQHSDAETLVAEVMSRVFRAAKRWSGDPDSDPQDSGPESRPLRFRAWLRRIAENVLLNLVTRQLSKRGTGGTSAQISLSQRAIADDVSRRQWNHQHQQHLFVTAAGQVQSQVDAEHWKLFWQTHVDGLAIEQAARQSGRSVGSVYAIRSRIVRRLRDTVTRIERLEESNLEGTDPVEVE
ncbi:RNA polymerase sigma factor RpoE [Stieleria maiorica]|uniref:RNA polymerase sigma factor RpoE n=1 Tax=Stieleria maiorica TaxID=2795974 RepID=A0A5B9M764_9BACT|nr:sigma-70 family RNA polymerase sigma factor [Stieleria maiorica]QEF97038.1 RNA polymerase sigma factor RpoE [Stieleria maiorica]